MKEYSKQYVRDALLEMGFDPEKCKEAPALSADQIAECSARYVKVCEQITGEPFPFPPAVRAPEDPKLRLIRNLESAGWISNGLILIFAGSDSDINHIEKLKSEVTKANEGGGAFKLGTQVLFVKSFGESSCPFGKAIYESFQSY